MFNHLTIKDVFISYIETVWVPIMSHSTLFYKLVVEAYEATHYLYIGDSICILRDIYVANDLRAVANVHMVLHRELINILP